MWPLDQAFDTHTERERERGLYVYTIYAIYINTIIYTYVYIYIYLVWGAGFDISFRCRAPKQIVNSLHLSVCNFTDQAEVLLFTSQPMRCGLTSLLLVQCMDPCMSQDASRYCRAGDQVWAFVGGNSTMQGATVLWREPGSAEIQLEGSTSTIKVPVTKLRTRFGHLCACVALCLFGRVGNLEGKFDEFGSNAEALAISAKSVWEHVIRANSEMQWDIFAHTWDEDMADLILEAYHPRYLRAEQAPFDTAIESFGESVLRSSALRRLEEVRENFRYDLVVLMRYDILFRNPLQLFLEGNNSTLWSSHWCSIHSEDLSVREVVLTPEWDPDLVGPDVRFQASGIFAPSQFVETGLHDFWFAANSMVMDQFAQWGRSRTNFIEDLGLYSYDLPLDVGHFHTFHQAKGLELNFRFTGISYLDFTLVRHKDCELKVGKVILTDPDVFCSHWEVSLMRECQTWIPKPSGWAHHFCPIAGHRAYLTAQSHSCGRF